MEPVSDPAGEAAIGAALDNLNGGFLGIGLSTTSELAYLALTGIVGYVAFSVARHYLAGSEASGIFAMLFGLRDD